ncbi:hypothetical protein MMIC_P0921 [Mariprofundus micogutta]|uniref:Uncharacterized protein n=1 Tax=Mariprofundus micogutta TaxID=1921010 RepID=A0A1L8CM08_9PROT|nr:hypothetical protein MMIC_P0921 [Mariprofundus micogutta]
MRNGFFTAEYAKLRKVKLMGRMYVLSQRLRALYV